MTSSRRWIAMVLTCAAGMAAAAAEDGSSRIVAAGGDLVLVPSTAGEILAIRLGEP